MKPKSRQIHPKPIKIPRELGGRGQPEMVLQNMSHVPGQAAAIRFFDQDSRADYQAIRQILEAKESRRWMDEASNISWADYREGAGKHTQESFLLAVHDSREADPGELAQVRGFVNLYSERGEKFRVKRIEQKGFLKQTKNKRHALEVSFALKPLTNGIQAGSGLMSSALRQSCLQVRALLGYPKQADLVIFAFIDPENEPSKRTLEASGFVRKGEMRYDSTTSDDSTLYILSWQKLHQKIHGKMRELFEAEVKEPESGGYDDYEVKVKMESQQTDSHCGPAVIRVLLERFGVDVTQDQVVESARVKSKIIRYGMTPAQMAKAVRRLAPGYRLWFKSEATINDMLRWVKEYKIPVGINWQGLFYDTVEEEKLKSPFDDHGHYSIVIDINPEKDQIVIADPYSEYWQKPRVKSYSWFKTRWWDKDILVNKKRGYKKILETQRLAFVILPKNSDMARKLKFEPEKNLSKLERKEIVEVTA